jgi:hypothetical protein
MKHAFDEQKIGNLRSNEQRSRRVKQLWDSKTPADTSCPQAFVHLRGCRKSQKEFPGE